MRLNDLFENNNKNRGYEPGFASPNAPSLGGRRQNDEPDGVNNIEVSINGRVWKIFAGAGLDSSPEFFRQKQKVDDMCRRKTQETGKKWTWGVTGASATNEGQGLNEFAPGQGGGDSGNYFQALASAWYNGTFDSGSLQKGIKSQEDVERLLQRGIVCPDGVTRKFGIDYNSNFDGVVISSDDYYEHADHDETDSRTGKPFGPYDYMEFGDDDLDESAKWRDPRYKGQLYTQEKPDYNDTREYDRAMWNPKPKGYQGRKELPAGGEYSNNDPLTKGFGRSGIKNSILDRGKRKGLPSRDQITSLKGSIRDAQGRHTRANLPEGMEGRVVFRGTGADGSTYEIIQSDDDFMIHANGKHIDAYGSLQRAMSVLHNEVPGLQQGVAENTLNEFSDTPENGPGSEDYETLLFNLAYRYWVGEDSDSAERTLSLLGWQPELGDDYTAVVLYKIGGKDHRQYTIDEFGGQEEIDESMAGKVVFSGTGADGGKYEIIQSSPTDFMIHANGRHIDTYGSLQRAMSVLQNEVPGLKKLNEAPVNLNDPQYQTVAQPERDTGARTFAAPGSSVTSQDLAPSTFKGKENAPTLPGPGDNNSTTVSQPVDADHVAADKIGNVFKAVQDVNQEFDDREAAKRAADPGRAAREKQYYQKNIVNPEFMKDLTDPGPEPVTPAKSTTSTAPVDNNTGTTTGNTLRDKINQAAGDQSNNSPVKAPNPVLSSPTQTAPIINKPPAKAPAAGTWQELAQLNKSTNPDPNRIFPGQKIKITPYGDEHIVKPGETLSSIANLYKGLDTPGKRKVRESAAQNDLYQILRNAGLKNTP